MYPKVFTEFATMTAPYGPVSVLPTPVYFYGMQAGESELWDREPARRSFSAETIGDTDEEGQVTRFLRAERPAPGHQGAESGGGGENRRAAQGRGRQ